MSFYETYVHVMKLYEEGHKLIITVRFAPLFALSQLNFAQNSRGNPCYAGRGQAYLILFAILSNKCEPSLV